MCPENEQDSTQGWGIDPNIPCDPQQAKYSQRDFSWHEEAIRTQGVGECLPWEREQKGKATYHLSDHVIDAEYLTCLFNLYIHQHNTFTTLVRRVRVLGGVRQKFHLKCGSKKLMFYFTTGVQSPRDSADQPEPCNGDSVPSRPHCTYWLLGPWHSQVN